MIDAKDLRIGNVISVPECSVWNATAETILAICNHELIAEPIPLTEEWLHKAGFEIKEDENGFKIAWLGDNPVTHDWLFILVNTGEYWFYRNGHFRIDYVHQLQNFTHALTGQEL